MFGLYDRNARTAPSHYPKIPFHGLRFLQLISSLIVGAIMCYFTYHLTHDHWATPWTFIFLLAASLCSIAALTVTILLHCCVGLNPTFNVLLNSALSCLWALGWALLTYYMRGTLANVCDAEHWNEDIGIMVCRIYKALFSFTLIALVSTLAATCLNIYVRRQQTRRGVYRLQDIDNKHRPNATRGPFTDDVGATGAAGSGLMAEPRESEAWEAPRPYREGGEGYGQAPGYSVPEGQVLYSHDTAYQGGHDVKPYGA